MPHRAANGFTLLELLLSLAIVAMLSAVLSASLYIGFHSRESATRSLESVQKASNAFTLLAQDFYGALPPKGVLAGEFSGTSPAGSDSGQPALGAGSGGLSTSNSNLNGTSGGLHAQSTDASATVVLSFYTSGNTPREDELGGDIRKVELSLETPEGSTQQALMRRIYYNLLPSRAPEPRVQILCRAVRNFGLRYYDGSLWYTSWDSKSQNDTLPLAVEATLEFDGPDPKQDDTPYRITRVFALPCGVTAAASSTGSTQ